MAVAPSGPDTEPGDGALPRRLNALLAERWPFCHDRIVHDAGALRPLPLSAPDIDRGVAAEFARYRRARPDDDRRGLASLWLQWYAVTVWPPLAAGALLLHQGPRLDAPENAVLVDAAGCPAGLRVGPDQRSGDADVLLEALMRHQTAPLIDALAAVSGLTPRVAWSNVANVLGWMLGELAPLAEPDTLAPCYALLARARDGCGDRNPLFVGGELAPATGRPPRRVCCLRYRLSDTGYCSDCPIPPRARAAG